MKLKKFLTNGYSSAKQRREILLGHLNPKINREPIPDKKGQIKNKGVFTCKCGRSLYDHPSLLVGDHYTSMPYHGDLCPFIQIGE